jgi:hypothetical protein
MLYILNKLNYYYVLLKSFFFKKTIPWVCDSHPRFVGNTVLSYFTDAIFTDFNILILSGKTFVQTVDIYYRSLVNVKSVLLFWLCLQLTMFAVVIDFLHVLPGRLINILDILSSLKRS